MVGVINIRRENQNPQDVRLPEDFTPISYNLDLIAVWDPDWIIDGFFSMSGISRTQDPTTKVYLSFSDMSFDENSIVVSSDGTELVILEHIYDFERSIYAIRYEPPGTEYNLEVSGRYEAYLKRRVLGFNRDFYTDVVTGEDVFLAVTQFEPNGARHAFPCMDEPALKAKFTVRLGHLDSLGARTNMPLVATGAPVDGYQGYVWSEFEESELMSPYVNAFLISDYVEVASTPLENGLPHSIWTRYDAVDDGLAEYIRVLGPEIIYAYEQYFQVDFTLPKMDQTSVPTKGGAMENWGLITYREDEVLIDPTLSSANAEHTLVSVEAHEIAHQWFGDLVTCDWWSYIWLNEGFATYVSYIGSEAVKPEMKNFELFVYLDLNDALRIDSLPSSHEISQETNTPESANFGPISYSKGGSLIRMVEAFLTTSAWKTGLTNYLNAKSLSTAVPDDLFYYWNEASMSEGILGDSHDVAEIMNTWTLQKNYPLLTVTRDYLMGTATVTQERYLTREDNSGDTHDYKWWIPITYSSVNDENSNFDDTFNNDLWLTPDDEELVVGTGAENSAVIFNVQYTGFYRVNYDSENWDRIADALKADHTSIHTINRAQLLADSFDFSDHGIIAEDYSVPLKIAQYLGTETEYIPLCFANDIFLALERHVLPLSPTAQALDDFIFNVFLDKYNAMEMDEHPDYTFQENLVQRIVVDAMCRVDQADCVNDALIR